LAGSGTGTRAGNGADRFALKRERMVAEQIRARGIRDQALLAAMAAVPREEFVPAALAERAYEDGALGIGSGQTISQPYIVARMIGALRLSEWRRRHPDDVPLVLDVGTGSGYGAAVLSAMGTRVIGIERDEELARAARERLDALGYPVEIHVGDGSAGWPDAAPYAGIVVAAAAPDVPEPLIAQLADGGRVIVPVGSRIHQELKVVERAGDRLREEWLEPCVFVPLVGRYGFPE
jgi:protein-L-isoaspartate(D-aspartate) O-methyltransferase